MVGSSFLKPSQTKCAEYCPHWKIQFGITQTWGFWKKSSTTQVVITTYSWKHHGNWTISPNVSKQPRCFFGIIPVSSSTVAFIQQTLCQKCYKESHLRITLSNIKSQNILRIFLRGKGRTHHLLPNNIPMLNLFICWVPPVFFLLLKFSPFHHAELSDHIGAHLIISFDTWSLFCLGLES